MEDQAEAWQTWSKAWLSATVLQHWKHGEVSLRHPRSEALLSLIICV